MDQAAKTAARMELLLSEEPGSVPGQCWVCEFRRGVLALTDMWSQRGWREPSATGSKRWLLLCLWPVSTITLTSSWSSWDHILFPTHGMEGGHPISTSGSLLLYFFTDTC